MKKSDENKLDQLFRNGLNDPESKPADFREEDWLAMEALLDEKKNRKRKIIWLYWASAGIAALLLLFFGWNWLGNNGTKPDKPIAGIRRQAPDAETQNQPLTDRKGVTEKWHGQLVPQIPRDAKQQLAANKVSNPDFRQRQHSASYSATDSSAYPATRLSSLTALSIHTININPSIEPLLKPVLTAHNIPRSLRSLPDSMAWLTTAKEEVKPKVKSRVLLSLALLTAPDLNKAGAGGENKLGGNAGIQVSAYITKRLSITTGAAYALKPYRIGRGQSNVLSQYFAAANSSSLAITAANAQKGTVLLGTTGTGPATTGLATAKPATLIAASIPSPLTGVMANCTVLDIPVNINYQVAGNARRSLSAGAGLSSYFMLTEHYSFSYADNSVRDLHVTNRNQHIMGVLNLNTTYQQQVRPNLKLLVQPYLKLPITQIGQEQVNLQSAGIAIGFSWNLSPAKPK